MEYSPMMLVVLWALTPSDCLPVRGEESSGSGEEIALPGFFTFNHGKPFLGEKDPLTGAVDLSLRTTPLRLRPDYHLYQGDEEGEEEVESIERKDTNVGPSFNEIKPDLHKFLNLPVHYSASGKFPLISSSYANTKVQGHGSTSLSNHRPPSTPSTLTPTYYSLPPSTTTTTTRRPSTTTTTTTTRRPSTTTPAYSEYDYDDYDYDKYEPTFESKPTTRKAITTTSTTSTTTTTTTTTTTPKPVTAKSTDQTTPTTTITTTSPTTRKPTISIITSRPTSPTKSELTTVKSFFSTNKLVIESGEEPVKMSFETRPVTEEPVATGRPNTETRLPSETRPTSETRPVSETRPIIETRPTSETRPVSETRPSIEVKPTISPESRPFQAQARPSVLQPNVILHRPSPQGLVLPERPGYLTGPGQSYRPHLEVGTHSQRPNPQGTVLPERINHTNYQVVGQSYRPEQQRPNLQGVVFPERVNATNYPHQGALPYRPHPQGVYHPQRNNHTNYQHGGAPPYRPLPQAVYQHQRHNISASHQSQGYRPGAQGPFHRPNPTGQEGPSGAGAYRPENRPILELRPPPAKYPGVRPQEDQYPAGSRPQEDKYSSTRPQEDKFSVSSRPQDDKFLSGSRPQEDMFFKVTPERRPQEEAHLIRVSPGQVNPSYSLQTSFSIGGVEEGEREGASQGVGVGQVLFPEDEEVQGSKVPVPAWERPTYPRPQWESHLKPPHFLHKRVKPGQGQRHDLPNILPQFRPNAKVGQEPVLPREPLDTLQPPPLPQGQVHRRTGPSRVTTLQMMQQGPPRRATLRAEPEQPLFLVYPSNKGGSGGGGSGGEGVVVGTRGPQRPLPPPALASEPDDSFPQHDRVDTPVLKVKSSPRPQPPRTEFPYPLVRGGPSPSPSTPEYTAFSPTEETSTSTHDHDAEINLIPYLQDYMPFATKEPPEERVTLKPISVTLNTKLGAKHREEGVGGPRPEDFEAPFQASLSAPSQGWSVVRRGGAGSKEDGDSSEGESTEGAEGEEPSPQAEAKPFDLEAFQPQLFGGFKPILPPREEEKEDLPPSDLD